MNLRTKITFINTAVAISIALLLIISIRGVVINAFRDELKTKSISIAGNLSDRIANHIILRDHFQTTRAFNEVMAKERDLEYIYVTSEEGDLFAHTFQNGPPPDLLSWNPLSGTSMNVLLLDTEKGYIRDAGVKVFEGTNAELHIGIREEGLKNTLHEMRRVSFPLIGLVILLGVAASFVLSRFITEPLNKFVEFTKVLGRGEFGKKVDVRYGDEIGYLARNFNRLSMELKNTQEKIEEAYTYTHLLQAEKLSSIGQISAGLAHELKNPMTTLKMLFQEFKEQPDMTKEDAEVISGEIEKIDAILTNFTSFLKQKSFHKSAVNLNKLLERVLSLATYEIENAGITVYRELIESLPEINADRSLLDHVFLNLILNAVQAMPHGGEIRISGKSDDTYIEIMIWDQGTGIPQDLHEKIFDPFFTTKEKGTGLGLSIAYNIVKSHDGTLFFNSEEGKGTLFTVRLPLEENDG